MLATTMTPECLPRSFGWLRRRPRATLLIRTWFALTSGVFLFGAAPHCAAQVDYEQPPISYLEAAPHDAVSQLQDRIDRHEVELTFKREVGFLPSVLAALDIPVSSQVLVFSKTSFQFRRISPRNPRAIYFNDDVYVGWVRGGDVVELSAVDPQLGANFYTLIQDPQSPPRTQPT